MSGLPLDDEESNSKLIKYRDFLGEGYDPDLPLFLNKGFAAFGSISIMKSKKKLKRGIKEWGFEDLEMLELGSRELNDTDLPVITLEKVICTIPYESIPSAVGVLTRVLKNKQDVLFEQKTKMAFRRSVNGVTYFERLREHDGHSSVIFEDIFKMKIINPQTDYITVVFTLFMPGRMEEDFEFEIMALSKSFYVKAVHYTDFLDRNYVLVLKNLKLHGNPTFDSFTRAFDRSAVFVDDFTSSRAKMPHFSPLLYSSLNRYLLSGRLMDPYYEEFTNFEEVEDEYVTKFYAVKFNIMRQDMIHDNFIKAKLDTKLWWEFASSMVPPPELTDLFKYHSSFEELLKIKENLGTSLCPEDRRGFSELLFIAILGIKSDVRPLLWESLGNKDGKYKVTEQLDKFTPMIIEQLYKMVNAKNTYEVTCLFRNHQRIVSHFMRLIEDVNQSHHR